jgi:hypothetical protein
MGSYGSQSVEAISNLMANEAKLKAGVVDPPRYRMPDQQMVTIMLPVGIVRKIAHGGWSDLPSLDVMQVRKAMSHALWDERDVKSDQQEFETVDLRKDLPA